MALIRLPPTRQLFLDDCFIESIRNARRVLNPAEKADPNPVLRPDKPWEGNYLAPSHVIYDPEDRLFKMWYSSTTYDAIRKENGEIAVRQPQDDASKPSHLCFARSQDGFHWEKPDLGLVEFEGSTRNNLVPPASFMEYMFLDPHDADAAKRFKGFIRKGAYDGRGMTIDLYFSPDGFHWTPYAHNPVVDTGTRHGRWGPTVFHGWDPIRQTYHAHMENCVHLHCPLNKRSVGRAESPDLIRWSEPETLITPDEHDPPDLEFYYMACLPYEGLYVGLLCAFRTNPTMHHVQLAFSRDGIRYDRRYRDPFVANGPRGVFDSSSIYPLDPILHGDRILIFYQGTNWRSPETLYELGNRGLAAPGLAVSPLDGFVSVDGGKEFGEVVTRSFEFSGKRLAITLKGHLTDGWRNLCDVRAEILSANHCPIPGFTFQDADPITQSAQGRAATWKGKSDISEFAGKPIRLRFYIRHARLYSFQFVD